MRLKTSLNKMYNAVYVEGPTRLGGNVVMKLEDTRPILEIGAEFDGLGSFEREDEDQGSKRWEGFSKLQAIRRVDEANILIELARG